VGRSLCLQTARIGAPEALSDCLFSLLVLRLRPRRILFSLSCTGGQPWGADGNSRNGLYRSARGSERLPNFFWPYHAERPPTAKRRQPAEASPVAVVAAMALGRAGHWNGECWCHALALVEEGLTSCAVKIESPTAQEEASFLEGASRAQATTFYGTVPFLLSDTLL
jgi:hypothetical protein